MSQRLDDQRTAVRNARAGSPSAGQPADGDARGGNARGGNGHSGNGHNGNGQGGDGRGRAPGRPRRPGAARQTRTSRPGTMRHKGYTAKIGYDDEAGVLRGEVVDLQDEISFSATSVQQLRQEFHAAVDAYLLDCATRGVEPGKPFSGRVLLRLPPDLHRRAAVTATAMDVSLNDFLIGCIEAGVVRIAAVRDDSD